MFLSFNYTGTVHEYIKFQPSFSNATIKCDVIHIHGELGNSSNPIIFGYGDEVGEEYSTIENLNDNAYLDNIKTMKYSETDNYKRLSNFINSDEYRAFIMGHSCGKSDRTLLKWIFEHKNCVSIKAFYHYDGLTRKDDFSDKIKNISRLFSDKAMMREKIVNKKDTCALDGYHIGN